MSRPQRRVLSLVLSSVLLASAATSAIATEREDARARNALRVLTDIQAIPENAIPDKLIDEARAPESCRIYTIRTCQHDWQPHRVMGKTCRRCGQVAYRATGFGRGPEGIFIGR